MYIVLRGDVGVIWAGIPSVSSKCAKMIQDKPESP